MLPSPTTLKPAAQAFLQDASPPQRGPRPSPPPLDPFTANATTTISTTAEASLITPPPHIPSFDLVHNRTSSSPTLSVKPTRIDMLTEQRSSIQIKDKTFASTTGDVDPDSEDYLDADETDSTASIGPPPVTYMANLIANQLMQTGASMFGRREDANCVLKVGARRFYVHVQMLASRSPTFRRIFDDMIANDAWGASSENDSLSDGAYSQRSFMMEDRDYDEDGSMVSYDSHEFADDESMRERQSDGELSDREDPLYPEEVGGPRSQLHYRPADSPLSSDASSECRECFDPNSEALLSEEEHQLNAIDQSMDQLSVSVRRSLRIRDDKSFDIDDTGTDIVGDQAASDESEDSDDYLPELSVAFADPEASHFEELLYWLYTGDNERWLHFFTPENYKSILKNILHLNIATRTVLDVCISFEATTNPQQGLQGLANIALCVPSPISSFPSSMPTTPSPPSLALPSAADTATATL